MYERDVILDCASGLVGWDQSADPSHTKLTDALKQSTSGFKYNHLSGVDFNYLEDMFSSQRNAMNTYLEEVWQSELVKLVNGVERRNKEILKSKSLLANFDPIVGRAKFSDTLTQDARFVGYVLMPHRSNSLKTEIKYIGMQITEVQSSPVRIYLYDGSQARPIATFDYSNTEEYSLEWEALNNFILYYRNIDTAGGGTYLLGYYENDPDNTQTIQLTDGQALYMEICSGCAQERKRRAMHQEYIGIAPIEIPNSRLNWNAARGEYDLPDMGDIENYTTSHTHGLLMKLNITCDISQVICQNINQFAEPLQHAVAIRVLYDCLAYYGHNATADSKRNREQILNFAKKYEAILNGYYVEDKWRRGLIDEITMDFSNMDDYCLPCKQDKPIIGRLSR